MFLNSNEMTAKRLGIHFPESKLAYGVNFDFVVNAAMKSPLQSIIKQNFEVVVKHKNIKRYHEEQSKKLLNHQKMVRIAKKLWMRAKKRLAARERLLKRFKTGIMMSKKNEKERQEMMKKLIKDIETRREALEKLSADYDEAVRARKQYLAEMANLRMQVTALEKQIFANCSLITNLHLQNRQGVIQLQKGLSIFLDTLDTNIYPLARENIQKKFDEFVKAIDKAEHQYAEWQQTLSPEEAKIRIYEHRAAIVEKHQAVLDEIEQYPGHEAFTQHMNIFLSDYQQNMDAVIDANAENIHYRAEADKIELQFSDLEVQVAEQDEVLDVKIKEIQQGILEIENKENEYNCLMTNEERLEFMLDHSVELIAGNAQENPVQRSDIASQLVLHLNEQQSRSKNTERHGFNKPKTIQSLLFAETKQKVDVSPKKNLGNEVNFDTKPRAFKRL